MLLTFFICMDTSAQPQTRKVLFLGNSYTAFNDLPQIIKDAAESVGDRLIFDSTTNGAYKLIQHITNPASINKIMIGGWDYVIMQGQSQEPITDEVDFYNGGVRLNDLIEQYNPCAVPMFFMTWGRKNGDSANCPLIPVMCTYESMDTEIKNSYTALATYLQTELSPVSVVWRYLRQNHPDIELYLADESHPSSAGSYAAACCFYTMIFKKDPALLSFNYNLNASEAAVIRNAAKLIVYDNLASWDFKQLPAANFNYQVGIGNNEIIFTNTMQNADNYVWDFGDGSTTSTIQNPTHSYANNGTYTVTLTASNCDLNGLHQSSHSMKISFCDHTPNISPETLMLCPESSGVLSTEAADSYQWYENGIPIPGATGQYLEARSNVTSYPSVMTTTNGCSELSKSSFVGVHRWMFQFLSINVSVQGNIRDGNKVCSGETLLLSARVNEDHLSQWYKDGVPIPFANNDDLLVTESGTYKVRVDHPNCSNMGGFSDDMAEPLHYEFIDCSLDNGEIPQELIVFPNPSKNILNFQTKSKALEVSVYDLLGKRVMTTSVSPNAIDISGLANGVYTVRIKLEDNTIVHSKFIRE